MIRGPDGIHRLHQPLGRFSGLPEAVTEVYDVSNRSWSRPKELQLSRPRSEFLGCGDFWKAIVIFCSGMSWCWDECFTLT